MATPKFKTKKGELTAYALACGYIEKVDCGLPDQVILEAFQCDGLIYRVTEWEGKYKWHSKTYHSLTDARREFKKIVSMKKHAKPADTLRTGTVLTTFPSLAAVG